MTATAAGDVHVMFRLGEVFVEVDPPPGPRRKELPGHGPLKADVSALGSRLLRTPS